MGVYDVYGNSQLKVRPGQMEFYKVGDKADIPNGVYLDYGGVVVIHKGKFIAEFETLTNKWGGGIEPKEVIEADNPLNTAINDLNETKCFKAFRAILGKLGYLVTCKPKTNN